ncbi:MAG: arsinothricin resistance N-acetyltransferase ArsN1 family B [Pirellulales bacterium]
MATTIRFATPDDAAGVLAIYAPYCESSIVSFEIAAPTETQLRERMARITSEYPWLVCEVEGQIAGYAYASRHRERAAYRWAVDVAVYIAEAQQRRNVGRALYLSLFDILREQGFVKAYAGITLPNPASVGLHEAMGFTLVGVFRGEGFRLGQWRDVGWWELGLLPQDADPPEPRAIGEVRGGAVVAAALAEGQRLVRTGGVA